MMAKYMRTISRKALAAIVALAMLLAMTPMGAWGAFAASGYIDMSDANPATSGPGWTYDSDSEVYTILNGADVAVTGDNNSPAKSQRRLQVATDAAVNITLDGVTIGAIDGEYPTLDEYNSPLKLNAGANVNLAIAGKNSLVAGYYQAGINVPEGTTLSISGDGVLCATGGYLGAGIGGGYTESGGEITISGGTVTATSGGTGAGIGGGVYGDGGTINISGGTVNATSVYDGAGIGGGIFGDGGKVIISGCTVTATSGGAGAGIGSGVYGDGGTITISDGTVTAISVSYGAGIGGGAEGSGGTITISGGIVAATGGSNGGSGIGGGYYIDSPATGGDITICGKATVTATRGGDADDIGGGYSSSGVKGLPGNQFIAAPVNNNPTESYKVVGDPTLPAGLTAEIPADKSMTVPEDSTLTVEGTINNEGELSVEGEVAIIGTGKLDNKKDGAVTIVDGGILGNNGALENSGAVTVEDGGTLDNKGTLANDGSVTIEKGGTLENDGDLINQGSVTIEKGGGFTGNGAVGGNPVKYAGADVSKPAVNGAPTELTIRVNPATLLSDTGQQIEYAISTEQAEPQGEWQGSATFTVLTPGTAYYVFARSKANNKYLAGKASVSDPIATKAVTTETPVLLRDIPGAKTPVEAGTTARLPKSVIFDDLTRADVTWTSADQSIAAIDPYGNLIGVKEGKTTLTATAKDGKTQTVAITVAKNVTTIRTPQKAIHMQRGQALTPPVCADSMNPATNKADTTAKLTWSSSNPKIATVNAATGKIKAKKSGKAKITATALNGEKLTITVNVTTKAIPLKTLTLKKAPTSLQVGKARLLSVKATPYQATNLNVTFSSSNRSILSVDKVGKITAKKKGKAKITIKAAGKKYAKIITVK
ncbi:MAG: Ig-like domain-containing protein [Clostridiales Family XIII bacterium]|jgi:uncharacterized protein YjdB|nr:Ig-like domain-containing protein [Clostridiales Family XIII bacterium]